jgi:hypothetical protein
VVTPQDAAHELLRCRRWPRLIADLERRYATVVIDTPPAPLVPDATLILRHVTACAPVVRAGQDARRSLKRLLECLPRERIIGWILNCERAGRSAIETTTTATSRRRPSALCASEEASADERGFDQSSGERTARTKAAGCPRSCSIRSACFIGAGSDGDLPRARRISSRSSR